MRGLRFLGIAAAAALVTAAFVTSVAQAEPEIHTYEVTITDLTAGQPFTPYLVALGKGNTSLFKLGKRASVGVQQIAENGNLAPLQAALASNHSIATVDAGTFPLVSPNVAASGTFPSSVTFTISGPEWARRFFWQQMLICTNDGFTGVSAMKLPVHVGDNVSVGTLGYDAGTEIDTEDYVDIVPPCQGLIGDHAGESDPGTGTTNPALAEHGVVTIHAGIQGTDDLSTDIHGWDVTKPVASLSIT